MTDTQLAAKHARKIATEFGFDGDREYSRSFIACATEAIAAALREQREQPVKKIVEELLDAVKSIKTPGEAMYAAFLDDPDGSTYRRRRGDGSLSYVWLTRKKQVHRILP